MNRLTTERAARILGAVAVAMSAGVGDALAEDFYLCAGVGTKTMPDTGEVITVWGFAEDDNDDLADGCGSGVISVPGPRLAVPAGDATLNIHVLNNLPQMNDQDVPLSIVIPGQIAAPNPTWIDAGGAVVATGSRPPGDYTSRVRSFATETGRFAVGTYSWTGLKPGTYLYQSGTHPALQVQMGLYGALTVDAEADQAYPGVGYDQDVVLLYSELDPALHAAVAADDYGPGKAITSTVDYRPRYFLVNGEPYSAASPAIEIGNQGDTVLLRMLNAGLASHSLVLQDLYLSIVAEDGNPGPYPRGQYSVFLPAGKTHDAVLAVDCAAPPTAGTRALYDRMLNLSNGGSANAGGMFTQLDIPDTDSDTVVSMCDNCTLASNTAQTDTDGDGYGNACDGDFNNNGVVDFQDAIVFRTMVGTNNPNGDFNGNGVVDFQDVTAFRAMVGQPPGPSAFVP